MEIKRTQSRLRNKQIKQQREYENEKVKLFSNYFCFSPFLAYFIHTSGSASSSPRLWKDSR